MLWNVLTPTVYYCWFLNILILLSLSFFFRVAGLCQEGERQLPGHWWVSGTYKDFIWLHVVDSCKHDRSCLTAKNPWDLPDLMCTCWFRKHLSKSLSQSVSLLSISVYPVHLHIHYRIILSYNYFFNLNIVLLIT